MPKTNSRAAVFAHYDREGIVDDYVLFYLSSLRRLCDFIVFVSTADLSPGELGKAGNLADVAIKRENAGYDFFSYKVGLYELKKRGLENYFEIILCNDSVYGPLYPIEEMFASMEKSDADFWGVTDSREIAHHIQSYFIVFRRPVFLSGLFSGFWAAMAPISDRIEVVRQYEAGLSQLLEANGFRPSAFVNPGVFNILGYVRLIIYKIKKLLGMSWEEIQPRLNNLGRGLAQIHPNPTLTLWKELLVKRRNPFLKIALFTHDSAGVEMEDYPETIKNATAYDEQLITRHLARVKQG